MFMQACYSWHDVTPPSIIQTMISLFVGGELQEMFWGQHALHWLLRLVFISSVPMLLLGGPYARWRQRRGPRYHRVAPGETALEMHPLTMETSSADMAIVDCGESPRHEPDEVR